MTTLKPVLADPLHACAPLVNSVRDSLVMAIRGECPFAEKSRHAENAGASVVMIFNTEPGLPIVPGSSDKSQVPSMVVTERTRREMRRLGVTQDMSKSSLRVLFEPDSKIGVLWKDLNKYLDVKKWPSESSEQKRTYHKLSLEHHPDKPGGSDERFEFLRFAYKKARYYSDPELQKSVFFDEYVRGH